MIGYLIHLLGGGHDNPPPSRSGDNTFLSNTGGKPRPANKFPIIRDNDGDEDSTWEYVDKGMREGWLIETGDYFCTTRNNQTAFGFIYWLIPPK